MLGLEVNAGAGGLICRQSKRCEGQRPGSGWHILQTPKLFLTRAFLATCPQLRVPRPPECGQGLSPFSRS